MTVQPTSEQVRELAAALLAMRDALTELSFSLADYEHDMRATQRCRDAELETGALMLRLQGC